MGVEMLYGRLPTMRSPTDKPEKSKSSASAEITVNRSSGNCPLKRALRSRSISIAVSRSRRSSKGRVRAPSPGPISTTASPAAGSTALTMRFSTAGSCRKCWPRRLRVFNALSCEASLVFEAHLDVGAVTQLEQPVLVGLVGLALFQGGARLQAAAVLGQAGCPPLHHLDQVPAERRFHRLADLARLERVHDALELGHRITGQQPVEVAAARSAAVSGMLARQFGKICPAG